MENRKTYYKAGEENITKLPLVKGMCVSIQESQPMSKFLTYRYRQVVNYNYLHTTLVSWCCVFLSFFPSAL